MLALLLAVDSVLVSVVLRAVQLSVCVELLAAELCSCCASGGCCCVAVSVLLAEGTAAPSGEHLALPNPPDCAGILRNPYLQSELLRS